MDGGINHDGINHHPLNREVIMSRVTAAYTSFAAVAAMAAVMAACSPDRGAPWSAEAGTGDGHLTAPVTASAVRTTWPSPADPGPPFYARIEPAPPHVPHDGAWAAVVFYRDPSCVRPDFDLLHFFDAPAAFGCPVTMMGSSIWEHGQWVGSPRVAAQRGTAVPVWFFPANELLALLAGGGVTIGALAAVPGRLAGVASHYSEVLHPHPLPGEEIGGGHPNPGVVISAHGRLEDGRSFQLLHNSGDTGRRTVRITFR